MIAAIGIAAALLAAAPLAETRANFYLDWYNHQWAIGYFGQYLRSHLAFPSAFNTIQVVGMAGPVFYGNLAYPLLAIPAVVLAPGIVLRLCAVVLFAAQYACVAAAMRRLGSTPLVARTTAILVVWATYALTVLYNRGAVTEFIATALLTCAVGLSILIARPASLEGKKRDVSLMFFCLTVAAGTHPITALLGVPFVLVLTVILWRTVRIPTAVPGRIAGSVAAWSLAGLACLAPWLYATSKYADYLVVRSVVPKVQFDPSGLDHWVTRFYPIPFDARVQPGEDLHLVSTPYLDVQVNMPLLLLFAVFAATLAATARSRADLKRLAFVCAGPVALFAFFTWISLSPRSYELLPGVAQLIQFPYRAITYQNLSILFGIFAVTAVARERASGQWTAFRSPAVRVATFACIALAAFGLAVKWAHAGAVRRADGNPRWILLEGERKALVSLPRQYYGAQDYATPRLFEPVSADERARLVSMRFEPGAGASFGEVRPMEISPSESTWIATNVQAFPWNRFSLDGRAVPPGSLRVYDGTMTAVLVPGGRHVLSVSFEPDRVWRWLRVISLVTLLGWLAYVAFAVTRRYPIDRTGSAVQDLPHGLQPH